MKTCEWCGKSPAYKYKNTINLCSTCRDRFTKHGRLEKNKYIDEGDYYKVITTTKNNKDKNFVLIDKEDYDKCKFISWYTRKDGYCAGTINGKKILMSRFLLNENLKIIDHINKKRNDNRKSNLRICEKEQEDLFNKSISSRNTSGYIGVTWDKENNKWISQISINGKNIKLGRFNNIHDALITRLKAEIKYFGEFSPQQELIKKYAKELICLEKE